MFQLPSYGVSYTQLVFDRCIDLITTGIWAGLHPSRLRTWFNQFSNDTEKYFAACLLDSLIYRCPDQTVALIHHLFQRTLPDLTRKHKTPLGTILDWYTPLAEYTAVDEPRIRFVTVSAPQSAGIKSSSIVGRMMKRRLRFREDFFISPEGIPKAKKEGICVFVFIDDFLGTGHQFTEFAKAHDLKQLLNGVFAAYTPLAAHTTGIQALHDFFPSLHVASVETLTGAHSVFSSESNCFEDGQNTTADAKHFYLALLRDKNIEIPSSQSRGYGYLELTYAFDHSIPDNSLPLLWKSSDPWIPLFDR
jgi:hypothetical protein